MQLQSYFLFGVLNASAKKILKKNQADWELAQKLYQAAAQVLTALSTLRHTSSLEKDVQFYTPVRLVQLHDQEIWGQFSGRVQGFAFFVLNATISGQLSAHGSSVLWGEGGQLFLQGENGESLRLVWLSHQALLNILRTFAKKIDQGLQWNSQLPTDSLDGHLAFDTHTGLALGQIFRKTTGSFSLASYLGNLNREVLINRLVTELDTKKEPSDRVRIAFTGDEAKEGVVVVSFIRLGANGPVFNMFPAKLFLETARLMQEATGIALLPELEKEILFGKETLIN